MLHEEAAARLAGRPPELVGNGMAEDADAVRVLSSGVSTGGHTRRAPGAVASHSTQRTATPDAAEPES